MMGKVTFGNGGPSWLKNGMLIVPGPKRQPAPAEPTPAPTEHAEAPPPSSAPMVDMSTLEGAATIQDRLDKVIRDLDRERDAKPKGDATPKGKA